MSGRPPNLINVGPNKLDGVVALDEQDISKDLAELEVLRQNVHNNLKLRPIRATSLEDGTPMSAYFTPVDPRPSLPIRPAELSRRLKAPKRPMLLDTRPLPVHLQFHIKFSINLAIPSLILKRCRKPGGGFQALDALRQFVTTDEGKSFWDDLLQPGGPWDGDVVIYDDEMDIKEKDNHTITAWALLSVISPLLAFGSVDYLDGGLAHAGHDPDLQSLIVIPGDKALNTKKGLFKLDTQQVLYKPSIEIDQSMSATSAHPASALPHSANINIIDATPSPPPSQTGSFRQALAKRPSAPSLTRINTKSAERLPKLSVRTMPVKSATLAVPPPLNSSSLYPNPPSPLYGNYSPASATSPSSNSNNNSHNNILGPLTIPPTEIDNPADYQTPYFTPPHTPRTPRPRFDFLPPSPKTARPDSALSPDSGQPPSTEDPMPLWSISTILPGFLFLGPEPTNREQVEEIKEFGVRRILNMAQECDADDHGLSLRSEFERYNKIPMRDTVEEEGVRKGVHEVCEILDDARLHSAPTYVHCKAGKSRSVTAVMAYLIHANHWTLSQAYTFVLERRKGISPNIGFVSELMTFEEEELGGKSIGVQPSAPAAPNAHSKGMGHGHGHGKAKHPLHDHHPNGHVNGDGPPQGVHSGSNRQRAHVRESLPPAFVSVPITDANEANGSSSGPFSAGGIDTRAMGDAGQEMEVKDASGRYRHARRAPVDEHTLQPLRRVSKAGLESSTYAEIFLSGS